MHIIMLAKWRSRPWRTFRPLGSKELTLVTLLLLTLLQSSPSSAGTRKEPKGEDVLFDVERRPEDSGPLGEFQQQSGDIKLRKSLKARLSWIPLEAAPVLTKDDYKKFDYIKGSTLIGVATTLPKTGKKPWDLDMPQSLPRPASVKDLNLALIQLVDKHAQKKEIPHDLLSSDATLAKLNEAYNLYYLPFRHKNLINRFTVLIPKDLTGPSWLYWFTNDPNDKKNIAFSLKFTGGPGHVRSYLNMVQTRDLGGPFNISTLTGETAFETCMDLIKTITCVLNLEASELIDAASVLTNDKDPIGSGRPFEKDMTLYGILTCKGSIYEKYGYSAGLMHDEGQILKEICTARTTTLLKALMDLDQFWPALGKATGTQSSQYIALVDAMASNKNNVDAFFRDEEKNKTKANYMRFQSLLHFLAKAKALPAGKPLKDGDVLDQILFMQANMYFRENTNVCDAPPPQD